MSNSQRYVIPKKHLQNEIKRLQGEVNYLSDTLKLSNMNLEDLETSYIITKEKLKRITDNNLFLALYEAFRLWRGERRV